MKVDRRDIESSLPQKGFRRESSGDHIYFYHEHNGRETGVSTRLSHSRKMRDISGDLLRSICRQLRLDRTQEVVDLLKCPMDGESYNEILIKKGVFDPDPL